MFVVVTRFGRAVRVGGRDLKVDREIGQKVWPDDWCTQGSARGDDL